MTPEHGPDQSELETLPDYLPIRRALLSVSDKDGIVEFARQLHKEGVKLISTGGTKGEIEAEGIPVTAVEEVTRFPEILDGRVKTLDPHIFAGILADRRLAEHMDTIAEHDIEGIDLVCVNLYPFEETVAKSDDPELIVENIDIGGPSMLRAAAKNFRSMAVVTSAKQYAKVIADIREHGGLDLASRLDLADETFTLTARYEKAISEWFRDYDRNSHIAEWQETSRQRSKR